MCLSPSFIYKKEAPLPERIPVPCRKCWQCLSNRVNDYVGRSLCEASTSDWVVTLTLTYAPRADLSDKYLTPRHFQQFIMRVRKRYPKTRYLVTGEYGDLKGRAHFHAILFGKGERPPIPNGVNCHIQSWPHGHVFADWSMSEQAIRYVCKYLLKDQGKQSWFSLSKKPQIGAEYFARRAQEYIDHDVFPSSFEYLPPNGSRKRPYLMTGATRRDFIMAIVAGTLEKHPLDRSRLSEWVLKSIEKYELENAIKVAKGHPLEVQLAGFLEELEQKRPTERQINRVLLDTGNIGDL